MQEYKIHVDNDSCDCSRCEPAKLDGQLTLGMVLSGNPACAWPACAIRATSCMWSNSRCFEREVRST